ncbi:unnamed protein product [Zymoseptoria tritici ST99CH_1A5]|uniref:Fucose-specific lectin n=1 Tax=Zymoseptoria tritici ST99CH_1A5 TaxID=1276529 RepID=A0A1Y6L311_ZYMTR|nr:unnamed protein product [Zymoseptoria tritici ST99CH_1A5]
MVDAILGLALSLATVMPTGISVVTGVAQGVSEQHKQNADAANQTRMLKFHLDVETDPPLPSSHPLHSSILTIHDSKLYIVRKNPETNLPANGWHPFTGFYIAYPDNDRCYTRGLVSTISVDPPVLNWIYIDKDSHRACCATRTGSIAHHVGSYDWTTEENEDSRVTLDGWEGWVAVEEEEGVWAVFYDWADNGLQGKVGKGRRKEDVMLRRRVITGQEVNQWGLKEEGNIGFKKTREV